jgi:hypothetical protein
MFSSNQKLTITGDDFRGLKIAIECALNLMQCAVESYTINLGGEISFYSLPNYGLVRIDQRDGTNLEYIAHLVAAHLASSAYTDAIMAMDNCGGDGSHGQGWKLYAKGPDGFAIKPFWTYYAK